MTDNPGSSAPPSSRPTTATGPDSSGPPSSMFGRYRLLEPIGRGGMAEVFKAKSFGVEGFEKVLVIKRIVPELAAHAEFVDMFIQEAKLAVKLSHANIVQVFDLGRIDASDAPHPSYYIAMEWVPGVDLATLLDHYREAARELPIGFAVFVATEVAKALDHAHRRQDGSGAPLGVVHRDISPQNILLSWEGDVKVTDFGIAKAADTIARDEAGSDLEASRATGKIGFMSPEQSRSERTDGRSDLFSLGTVLYQLLAGANPFTAPTVSETIRRINAGEYPPLRLARSDVPEALSRIVDRLLAASPDERYPSASALTEELMAFSYTSSQRFGAADLAALLAPLRKQRERGGEEHDIEPHSVLSEHTGGDQTPVEIPHTSTPPPRSPPDEAGERREVTLMVLSFGQGESLPADVHRRVREVLDRHGAWLESKDPAQVVAIFGLGDTDGRDAEAAVRAALVLVRERRYGAVPSVGIHSGPISVDDGGIPVNDERLASLLSVAQSLARATEGQVSLSPLAGRLVRRSFVTEALPESHRAVTDGLVVRRAVAGSDKIRGKFVGRTEELKRIGKILALSTRAVPQILVVRGETGLGKSRLIAEARRRLERGQFKLQFHAANCPLNGASVPWSGLRAMLHALCGTQEDDDPQRIREVRPRLRALGLRDEQAASVLNLLGARVKGADTSEQRAILRASFERMVLSLCRDSLQCFAWDDAQAIDRETLDAMLRIMRRYERLADPPPGSKEPVPLGLRAVFILAQRGEVPPALLKRPELKLIELEELDERDTGRLIEAQLGARAVPPELLGYVRSCAGGHPLFVEELVRELCDTGVVRVLNGIVTISEDAQASAPRTLRTLIADRVSRLQQRERKVLQGLAVLGEPAFSSVLSSVIEQSLPSLDRNLSALEQKGLIRRVGHTQIRFASPLYQEIVHDAMPPSALSELHARAATTYAEAQLPGVGEAAERAAEHLLGAGEKRRAVDAFWRSADEKLAADQLEDALRAMLRGIELADPTERSPSQLCEWLGKIAGAVSQVRKAPGLREAVAAAVREIESRGERSDQATAHIHTARALGSVNLFDEAYQALAKADHIALEDPEIERMRLNAEAQLAVRQGLFLRAIQAGERLVALGHTDDLDTLLTLALARAMSGDCDAALALMDRVDALSEPADAIEAVNRQKHRVLIHMNRRDYETAARAATELAALARAAGLRFDTAATQHNLGDIYDRLGDHPRAYAAFVDSLELARQLEQDRLINLNKMHLCLLDGLRSAEGAEARLKAHIRHADAKGYLWDVLEGRFLLARLAASEGDHERAREVLEQVMQMASEHGHKLIQVDAAELLASIQGDSLHGGER